MKAPYKQRVAEIFELSAPVGGIDDTSSIAGMSSSYAVDMVNYFPEAGALKVRFGYQEHVTGMTAPGKTIMTFNKMDGTTELFCCTDDGIYDITSASITPSVVKVITEGKMSWTTFSNIAGQWLICCNGVDPAIVYNGTTWTNFANVAVPANPGEITTGGVAPADILYVHQHKNRIWFIEKDTMSLWYWPLNAVSGATTEFPLGGIFTKGGNLSSIFSWTLDSGVGVDDIFVIQSDKGELAGYNGADPDTAGEWIMTARYFVGSPLGSRSHVAVNGDVLILTEFGVVPLTQLVSGQYQIGSSLSTASGRISKTLNNLIRDRRDTLNWEIINSPVFQYVVLNIAASGTADAVQFVMNSLTGAWTTFDLPAITFAEYGSNLYFTDSSNRVLKYGSVFYDEMLLDGTGGETILAGFQQAYSYFDRATVNKHYKFVRPVFETTYTTVYTLGLAVDFQASEINSIAEPSASTPVVIVGAWDEAQWDEFSWALPFATAHDWNGVAVIGYSCSLIIRSRTSVETRYIAAHCAFESGSMI